MFMFDDFDQIWIEESQEKVKRNVEALRNTKINQIWISTEPDRKTQLEDAFGTIAFEIPS